MNVPVGLGQPEVVEFSDLGAGLRKQPDVGADLQKAARHPAVVPQNVEIPNLRLLARAYRDLGHVLGLPLIERLQLIVAVVALAIMGITFPAAQIGEEDPARAVTGQELAVLLERDVLGAGIRGYFTACRGNRR